MLRAEIINSSIVTTYPDSSGNIFIQCKDRGMIQPAHILGNLNERILFVTNTVAMKSVKKYRTIYFPRYLLQNHESVRY